jgi:hypothetical protein
MTPQDDMAFVGWPPLIRPEADEVHISVAFTWDIPLARLLAAAWRQHYPVVHIGGPAMASPTDGFEPGVYVRHGATFTSRGCDRACPWCLVPAREGKLRLISPIPPGYSILDNNFLACPPAHRRAVYKMLGAHPRELGDRLLQGSQARRGVSGKEQRIDPYVSQLRRDSIIH